MTDKVTWKDWTVEISWLAVVSVLNVVFRLDRFQDTPLSRWYVQLGVSVAVIAIFEIAGSRIRREILPD
ncbi:hypothetical protein [Actinoplanes xinjiangensis]|uniref:Uncharacterized protein n=1 Tax=Actinoplanes xinjiangensis TaxID=512350 RepID=A0A316FE84_9ACTN|nr:hypothetical protein [Actinoplanes xinjiangensis]PWK47211.1 hypothetical protein BC793_108326 [Actinoplanes xinjiangensis]GIF40370.1 hypothetical protein Axi01nite_46810 [Actinoplanes xinjiangensis]